MNLLAMRTELRPKLGNPTVANVPDSELTSAINAACRFIGARYPFNELRKLVTFPTAVGTARYDLPPDLAWIRRVWDDTNKRKIRKRGISWLASLPLNQQANVPLYYVRAESWIQFVPSVNGIYTIMMYYQFQPSDLVADGDVTVLPAAWHDGVVLKARHLYYDGKGDVGKAIYARKEWKDWVADKPSEIDQEKEDLDDGPIELPELSGWRTPVVDRRFNPLFDYEC